MEASRSSHVVQEQARVMLLPSRPGALRPPAVRLLSWCEHRQEHGMVWWRREPTAEQVASAYATAIFEALQTAAQTKAVPPRGSLQILGTLQARLAAGHATTLAPKATAALMGSLAERLAALNAGLADYEQSYLGRLDASILRATAGIDEPAQPEQAQSGAN